MNKKQNSFNIRIYMIRGIILLAITAALMIVIRYSIVGTIMTTLGDDIWVHPSMMFLDRQDEVAMIEGNGSNKIKDVVLIETNLETDKFQEGDKVWAVYRDYEGAYTMPPKKVPYFVLRFYPHPMICVNLFAKKAV